MEISAPLQSSSEQYVQVAGRLHTGFLLVILMVWAFVGKITADRIQAAANSHRIPFYLLTILVEWLVFAYVLAGVRRRGNSTQIVLEARWRSFGQFVRDLAIAAAFWIVAAFTLFIVAMLLHAGSDQRNLQFLLPRDGLELALWTALSISAGVCEETIFRGYLQRQLIVFTKSAPAGILFSAAVFGLGHMYQGSRMTIVIAVYGLMFGILAHWRRSIRPGMIAHAWQDSLSGLVAFLRPR